MSAQKGCLCRAPLDSVFPALMRTSRRKRPATLPSTLLSCLPPVPRPFSSGELQKTKQQIAILIDEYGGFSGIVTLEDIIEQVMGDIDDEYDEEEEIIDKIDDNTYLVDGDVSLDDLDEEIGVTLESESSETIGGFIIDILGEIPDESDVGRIIEFENYQFKIMAIGERRIERVKIYILEKEISDGKEVGSDTE